MLAEAGFDIAHAFDSRLIAELVPGLAAHRAGVLVGNTRALWPQFLAARAADPALAASHDPIDRYTEQSIARAFPGASMWFAHQRYDGAFLPFQRVAVAVGLGVLAPTQLVIHPIYGPWFALRAIVATDDDPPALARPTVRCCTGDCEAKLAVAIGNADWRAWLAVRDACNVGRAYRYSDDQITYHYTKRSL